MKFYLKVLNPVIALVIFLLCFWASTRNESVFTIYGMVMGGMSTYFFAKGIFTSISLLILGKILLEIKTHSDKSIVTKTNKNELIYSLIFGIIIIGSLSGLFMYSNTGSNKEKNDTIINPADLKILDIYRIRESDKLKFSGKLTNLTKNERKNVNLIGKLYINGNFSDEKSCTITYVGGEKTEEFLIRFDDFCNMNVPDSVKLDIVLEGKCN